MLAAGARIGEILALRDLAAERPTLTICGTLVFIKGQGFFRQPWTKSDAGYRRVALPRFSVGMLMARKLTAADNPTTRSSLPEEAPGSQPTTSAVSGARPAPKPTSTGSPGTAVAALIKEETGTKSAAAQLGHSSEEVTDTYYIAKPVQAPDVSGILERLGSHPSTQGSSPGENDAHR